MKQQKQNILKKEAQKVYYSTFLNLWRNEEFGKARQLQNFFRVEYSRYMKAFISRDDAQNNKYDLKSEFSENLIEKCSRI